MAEIGQLSFTRRRPFPNAPCYVCRSCTAVVGYAEHLVSYYHPKESGVLATVSLSLFLQALDVIPDCFLLTYVQPGNVFVDLRSFERGVYHLCTLYCGNCYRLVGWKIDRSAGPLSRFFAEGRYVLFARCLYFWNTLRLQDPVWSPSAIR